MYPQPQADELRMDTSPLNHCVPWLPQGFIVFLGCGFSIGVKVESSSHTQVS